MFAHAVVLTGTSSLVPGAFSMGTGEFISAANQNELARAEATPERQTLALPRQPRRSWRFFRKYGARRSKLSCPCQQA